MIDRLPLNGFFTASQKRRFAAAAEERRSCRRFEGSLSISQWAALGYAAQRSCLPGVRIVLGMCDDSFFKVSLVEPNRFSGVKRFAGLVADMSDPFNVLLAGISGEAFVLAAADNGVSTCWVSQSYRKKESPITLASHEALLSVIALGCPAKPEKDIKINRVSKPVERCVRGGSIIKWPEWAKSIAMAVRLAPFHGSTQPWVLSHAGNTVFFYANDKYLLETGIAMLHAEAVIQRSHLWSLAGGEMNTQVKVTVFDEDLG